MEQQFMGIGGIWQWIIILVVVLVLFGGRGKLSSLMSDLAKGIKAFKSGLREETSDIDKPNIITASSDDQKESSVQTNNKDKATKT